MQSQVRTPEELNGFKHTLGASTAGDSDAAARLREAIEQEKVMERRRLRRRRADETDRGRRRGGTRRPRRDERHRGDAQGARPGPEALRRMANNQLTADDHGALKAIVATASTATPLPSSDALSRALQVWLPDNYAELLGVAPARSTPEKAAEAAPAATGDKAAAPAAGPRPLSPPLKATPKRRPWTADTCSRTPPAQPPSPSSVLWGSLPPQADHPPPSRGSSPASGSTFSRINMTMAASPSAPTLAGAGDGGRAAAP